MRKRRKSGRFFEKKLCKKLLLIWTVLVKPPSARIKRSFLVLFFKKELLANRGTKWR
jgi:hypothetical protein